MEIKEKVPVSFFGKKKIKLQTPKKSSKKRKTKKLKKKILPTQDLSQPSSIKPKLKKVSFEQTICIVEKVLDILYYQISTIYRGHEKEVLKLLKSSEKIWIDIKYEPDESR